MISIRIEGLVKTFGSVKALDGISLTVEPGEIFFLLGPSGCGKTTLLRTIAGFCEPDAGRVFFGDRDVTSLPPHRRDAGMVFQSYALWPHKTVAGNVAFGLEERRLPRAEIRRRVGEALDAVRMSALADRRIAQLSGGQQQRVALARALVVRPQALLLDEPLSNLDAKLRIEMRAEIRRVCKEAGLTAIYVTHDQKEALSISDRMAILDAGRIAQTGRPEDIYRRPHSRMVADFIGETNFLPGRITGGEGDWAIVETPAGVFAGRGGVPGQALTMGEEVTLSIRPECWEFRDGPAARNQCVGRVSGTTYLGEMAQHQFVCGGLSLKVFELNPKSASRPADRDDRLAVRPEDVIILRS